MPVIFKSKATGDLLMVSAHAQAVLEVLGKSAAAPGILIPEDMATALTALRSLPEVEPEDDDEEDEARAKRTGIDGVSLRKRAWPLLKMIEEAQAANTPIVWGV
jgi:hypothetical protein